MSSLADKIEQYLKFLVDRSENGEIEIQRLELADTFGCAPSQITYVLSTRFGPHLGYVTESKRGGKGYVRIRKVIGGGAIPPALTQDEAISYLAELCCQGMLTEREASLLGQVMRREVLAFEPADRDRLRSRMLSAVVDWLDSELPE